MANIRAKRHAAESQARWAKWGAANSVATGHAAKAGRADSEAEPQKSKSDTASAAARAARRSGVLCSHAFCPVRSMTTVRLLQLLQIPYICMYVSCQTGNAECMIC